MPEAVSLAQVLRDEDVFLNSSVETKAALLADAAEHIGRRTGIAADVVREALEDREKLGSTAIGQGIAIPHTAIDGLGAPAAVMFRLSRPIEFEAADASRVDLVFVVVWPSDKRSGLLAALGQLCRTLRAKTMLQDVRRASSAAAVRQILEGAYGQAAARFPDT
jgi:PTS system nitrogen regulatory IIA component